VITFVYRSHYAGPLSKRVVRLPATSIVAWFTGHMARAVADPDVGDEEAVGTEKSTDALWNELGGYVYGLQTIFHAAKEHGFEPPGDMDELRELLHAHLYVEGGPKNIQVDDHSVRVLTDDDEVRLAYFFFDDAVLAERRDRLAYLVHDEPRLPPATGDGSIDLTAGLRAFTPKGDGPGATYACLFTFYDGDSLPGTVGVFEGVRLPELAAHMRAVVPDATPQPWSEEYLATWPLELRLLRAMLEPGDTTFAPALERVQQVPIQYLGSSTNHSRAGVGPHADAKHEFAQLAGDHRDTGCDPSKSIIDEQPHALLFAMHASKHFGHQQWILFDDVWAAAHPDLARSLLRYGSRWDPLREK
jgi:hypothetical protein